jgi:Tfp pilus assembly protein PilO
MGPDRRKRILMIAAIISVGAVAGDRVVLSPLLNLWKARTERVAELEKSLGKGRVLAEREETMKERWQEMKERSLPVDMSLAEDQVLKSVGRWARDSRLSVTSLKPRWLRDEDDFRKLEFRAAAEGNMESIARFVYELERDPLPLKIEDIEIAARDERGDRLSLGVRFSGLVLMEENS